MSYETAARTYESLRPKGGSPRETEGRALLEAARRMAEAQTRPHDKVGLNEVARLNWRLWTILQSEICAPECTLPPEIRTNMLNLCNFVDKHMVGILADPQAKKLDVLINVNRQIAAGLLSDANQPQSGPEGGSQSSSQSSPQSSPQGSTGPGTGGSGQSV